MNILYFSNKNVDFMSSWQNYHMVDELGRYGIDIKYFDPGDYENAYQANEKLIYSIDKYNPHLFMTDQNDDNVFPETIKRIKQAGIPTLLLCHDNLLIPFVHKNICKLFDLVWLFSEENSEYFVKWGANIIVLPYAANPFFFRPTSQSKTERCIAFIGNPYGSRVMEINEIIKSRANVKLYFDQKKIISADQRKFNIISKRKVVNYLSYPIGRKVILGKLKQIIAKKDLLVEYKNVAINSPLNFDDMRNVYSNAALIYASTCARNTGYLNNPVPIINLRSFEIPMCGGIQFCRYNSELSGYFKEDKEIIFFHNMDDLRDKCLFYTKRVTDEQLNKIKRAARHKAENCHSWLNRFSTIFDRIGINVHYYT